MGILYFYRPCVFSFSITPFGIHRYRRKRVFDQLIQVVRTSAGRSYSMGQKEKFMIVGLGNHDLPLTRHSVGMRLVNRLAQFLEISFEKQKECQGFVANKELAEIHIVLLKSRQPMNLNGTSVSKAANKYKVAARNIYLAHDDLERPVGKVSLKEKGSAGGHNGVKSVIQSLRTDEIPRIRIGINRPTNKDEVSDYVLQKFTDRENVSVHEAVDLAILLIAQHIGARTGLQTSQVFSVTVDVKPKPYTGACGDSQDLHKAEVKSETGLQRNKSYPDVTDNMEPTRIENRYTSTSARTVDQTHSRDTRIADKGLNTMADAVDSHQEESNEPETTIK